MGIKHRADSDFRKFRALIKLGFERTVNRFESPYVSYPIPLYAILELRTYLLMRENDRITYFIQVVL